MCGNMVDIQSPTTENREEGKKRKKKKQETIAANYNVHICYAGQP